ncbi:N-acetylglucosamine-6-phosphate deacetylase [Vannielia sp.]|uniref:N-acetylglucosamine-6-phosphate deacetylase n=1 Tax=Vannielia sp. TaxID=2813045 RepID=UPI0026313900|nr:N-acetylglucosamine-6-phosphate deacetylase [Vannielia sp.]MDF1872805.1 N-acetylglucosamine-6-phosphate deacetylase [Vannielia sp.]
MSLVAYRAAALHDGKVLCKGRVLLVEGGVCLGVVAPEEVPGNAEWVDLGAATIAPGLVDLQVNGGGGVMLNDAPDAATIARICTAHAAEGTTTLLPTLITDRPEATRAAIAGATAAGTGLHLEGPHLDPRRAGAHAPALIRAMEADDLALLCEAAKALPALLITLAPASATPEQIAALVAAGAVVSLGHAECSYEEAAAAERAGARSVTHLFNAMSQMQGRTPGLVGAALSSERLAAGLICDGIHVHPANMRTAMRARPEAIYLVSDAMAVAGTALDYFNLNDREILRRDGRLTLADGTLAGADLVLLEAVRNAVAQCGTSLETALAMATGRPAALMGLKAGRLEAGAPADIIVLGAALDLVAVYRAGSRL